MALTLVALVDAIARYAGKADPRSIAAFRRNIALLRGRVVTLEASVVTLEASANLAREAIAEPAFDVPAGYFTASDDDTPYLIGGSPSNPNGVTFTPSSAVAWWTEVFAHGVNYSNVRPTLLPGSLVLTAEGKAAASLLAKTSLNIAPESYNPLNLTIVP